MAAFTLLGKVVSGELKDWLTNQRAPEAWGDGERLELELEEAMWAREAEGATEAKSTWARGPEDAREVCVEDADTITVWGFVDCGVSLDAVPRGRATYGGVRWVKTRNNQLSQGRRIK